MRQEFEDGDGAEIGCKRKMHALHSSSALCCNVFGYLRTHDLMGAFLGLCGLRAGPVAGARFEARFRITDGPQRARFPRPANLDLVVEYGDGRDPRVVAVESKFTEPYQGHARPLSPAYLQVAELWRGLTHCKNLARAMNEGRAHFAHLEAAQLLKHVLALRNTYGAGAFVLAYLWFDVGGDDGRRHSNEIEELCAAAREDGVTFVSKTYQELIPLLAQRLGESHRAYTNYLAARYLV